MARAVSRRDARTKQPLRMTRKPTHGAVPVLSKNRKKRAGKGVGKPMRKEVEFRRNICGNNFVKESPRHCILGDANLTGRFHMAKARLDGSCRPDRRGYPLTPLAVPAKTLHLLRTG